eukprot:999693-Rhodomonas_salina.1
MSSWQQHMVAQYQGGCSGCRSTPQRTTALPSVLFTVPLVALYCIIRRSFVLGTQGGAPGGGPR